MTLWSSNSFSISVSFWLHFDVGFCLQLLHDAYSWNIDSSMCCVKLGVEVCMEWFAPSFVRFSSFGSQAHKDEAYNVLSNVQESRLQILRTFPVGAIGHNAISKGVFNDFWSYRPKQRLILACDVLVNNWKPSGLYFALPGLSKLDIVYNLWFKFQTSIFFLLFISFHWRVSVADVCNSDRISFSGLEAEVLHFTDARWLCSVLMERPTYVPLQF